MRENKFRGWDKVNKRTMIPYSIAVVERSGSVPQYHDVHYLHKYKLFPGCFETLKELRSYTYQKREGLIEGPPKDQAVWDILNIPEGRDWLDSLPDKDRAWLLSEE